MTRRGEFTLISELFAPLAQTAAAMGLRDDAAYLTPRPGYEVVLKTDTVIAGVHFRADDPADLVARKALRVSLSDLAAKGAQPLGVLQALTLAPDTDDAYLEAYARGLAEDLKRFDVALLGGDTTAHLKSGKGPLTITVTAVGEVPAGTALLRTGARAGDLLCVSGTIGDAAIGLRAADGKLSPLAATYRDHVLGRYLLPEPRLALGRALRGIATACLDISDGLVADVGHICESSGVSAEILWPAVPRSRAADRWLMDDPSLRDIILGGGDDYELAFTVPPDRRQALPDIAAATGTMVTPIGRIGRPHAEGSETDAKNVKVLGDFGQEIEVPVAGFTHG
jgi:thiamine-monophosphate kinase